MNFKKIIKTISSATPDLDTHYGTFSVDGSDSCLFRLAPCLDISDRADFYVVGVVRGVLCLYVGYLNDIDTPNNIDKRQALLNSVASVLEKTTELRVLRISTSGFSVKQVGSHQTVSMGKWGLFHGPVDGSASDIDIHINDPKGLIDWNDENNTKVLAAFFKFV